MDQIKSNKSLQMKESTSFEDSEALQKEIDRLYGQLPTLSEHQQIKKLDVFLDKFDLSIDFDQKIETSFILAGLLVKREITMFASAPGTGKSLSTIAMANMALNDESVSKVVYFDDDNGLSTIIDRGIHNLNTGHGLCIFTIQKSRNRKCGRL